MSNASAENQEIVVGPRPWTPQERFLLERILAGQDANLEHQADNVVRPEILRTILAREPYRTETPSGLIRILHISIEEEFVLENARLLHGLEFVSCRFRKEVRF